jgi:hypothetical protein
MKLKFEVLGTGYLHYTTRVIWEDSSIHWPELKGANSKNGTLARF